MKKIKKILKIRKNNLLLKEDSDFDELSKMTIGTAKDISSFAKDSAKFAFQNIKFLKNNFIYTIRASLGLMSLEDFEKAMKESRIKFIDNTDSVIKSVDSKVSSMMSDAGVSETEISAYLLGIPGYSALESINISNILTGRTYSKARYSKLNPLSFDTLDLIRYFMLIDILPKNRKERDKSHSDQRVRKILNENRSTKVQLERLITIFLNKKIFQGSLDKINKLKKTKSQKTLNIMSKALSGTTLRSDKIGDKKKANDFITKLRSSLREIDSKEGKLSNENFNIKSKNILSINNNTLSIITEVDKSYKQDDWTYKFLELINSLAVAIALLDEDIQEILIGDLKRNVQEEINTEEATGKFKENMEDVENQIDMSDTEKFLAYLQLEKEHYNIEIEFFKKVFNDNAIVNSVENIQNELINTYKTKLSENNVFNLLNKDNIIENFLKSHVEKNESGYEALSEAYNKLKSEEDKSTGDEKKILERKIKLLFLEFFSKQYEIFTKKVKSEDSYLKKISSLAKQVNENNINTKYLSEDAQSLVTILESFNPTSIENLINTVFNKSLREIEKFKKEIKSLEEKASEDQQRNPKSSQQQKKLNRNEKSGDTTGQQKSLNLDQDSQSSGSTQTKSPESKEEKQNDSQSSEVEDSEKSDSQQEDSEDLKKSFFNSLRNNKNIVKEIVEFACKGLKKHKSDLEYEFDEQSDIRKESLQLIYNLVVYCSQNNSKTFSPLELLNILNNNKLGGIVGVATSDKQIFNKEELINAFTITDMTKFTGKKSDLEDLFKDLTG